MSYKEARNIIAQNPIGADVEQHLAADYPFSEQYLADNRREHQAVIWQDLVRLDCMLALSNGAINDHPSNFANGYKGVLANPHAKYDFDIRFVTRFLSKLGPANELRDKSGKTAAPYLGKVRKLLYADYVGLPKEDQQADWRFVEGLIAEEIALLWTPTPPQDLSKSVSDFASTLIEPVTPDILDAHDTPEKLWLWLGQQLYAEAAVIFAQVAAHPDTRDKRCLKAMSHHTDMMLRSLRIQVDLTDNLAEKQALKALMVDASRQTHEDMSAVWRQKHILGLRVGKIYEHIELAAMRRQLLEDGHYETFVRLAMPREDDPRDTPKYVDATGKHIQISADIIEESYDGTLLKSYQVKAMDQNEYLHRQWVEEADNRAREYARRRITLSFLRPNEELLAS